VRREVLAFIDQDSSPLLGQYSSGIG
jgi:hypothetical protein